jgi:hypothetical protein
MDPSLCSGKQTLGYEMETSNMVSQKDGQSSTISRKGDVDTFS